MSKDLRPEQVDILVGSPAVLDEFSRKVRELDRRLQANGMSYRDWEALNDRQHDIFSHDMFLDGECAANVKDYVVSAVESCGCADTVEDLHHHSPVLMREIEKQQDMLPDMTVKIGESLNNLNDTIDLLLENIILSEQEKLSYKEFYDMVGQRIDDALAEIEWARTGLSDREVEFRKSNIKNSIIKSLKQRLPYSKRGDVVSYDAFLRAGNTVEQAVEMYEDELTKVRLDTTISSYEKAQERYTSLNNVVAKMVQAAVAKDQKGNPDPRQVAVKEPGGVRFRSDGSYQESRRQVFTNTLGPREARTQLLNKIADELQKSGAETELVNYKTLEADWTDGFNYSVELAKGAAVGLANKGDVLEGIIGAAYYLRFLNPTEDLTVDDILDTIGKLKVENAGKKNKDGNFTQRKGTLSETVERENGNSDTVKLSILLGRKAFEGMRDTEKFSSELGSLARASIGPVNLPRLKDLAIFLANNDRPDTIEVSSIGTENVKATKADLRITINKDDVSTNIPGDANALADYEDVVKTLGSLSLKLKSTLLGQTGKDWSAIEEHVRYTFGVDLGSDPGWGDAMEEFSKEILDAEGRAEKKKVFSDAKIRFKDDVLDPMFDALKKEFPQQGKKNTSDDEVEDAVSFIEKIVRGIRKAGTGYSQEAIDDPATPPMGFLNVSDTDFEYLDFYARLEDALLDKSRRKMSGSEEDALVDLAVAQSPKEGGMLLFYDKNKSTDVPSEKSASNVLFSYRGKPEGSASGLTFRTYIEYGPRLAEVLRTNPLRETESEDS
jgi:hypothetical protein